VKFGYALFGGVGALVLEGALDTAAGGFLRYFFVGVVLAVGFWLLRAIVKGIRGEKVVRPTRPVVIQKPSQASAPAAPPPSAPSTSESSDPDLSSTPPQS
jgi:hypothetical protein